MGKKRKLALKEKPVSRLHGREGLSHTKLAGKERAAAHKASKAKVRGHKSTEAGHEVGSLALQRRKREKKDVVHELVGMLVKEKKTRYMKESRGAGLANTSRLIAELHEEIGEHLQAATAYVAAAQEILEAHNVEEEEKMELAKGYFSKAAKNYEKAGKNHKAEWANSQAENAEMKEAA